MTCLSFLTALTKKFQRPHKEHPIVSQKNQHPLRRHERPIIDRYITPKKSDLSKLIENTRIKRMEGS